MSLARLKAKLQGNKPWAIMGMTKKQYIAARPWSKIGDRDKFEEFLLALGEHPGLLKDLKDYATAEALVEQMFGESGEE